MPVTVVVRVTVVTLDPVTFQVVDEYDTLVNPERDVGPVGIHGITASMVEAAPIFQEIAVALGDHLGVLGGDVDARGGDVGRSGGRWRARPAVLLQHSVLPGSWPSRTEAVPHPPYFPETRG